ncbi:META domain-containing protein [Corynebacterium sp. A21]|uniref:META domain-containing protein n=1 Tax=Corynebacterium sp. A21 TaxID=3457318 RepID=UPI003FCF7A04
MSSLLSTFALSSALFLDSSAPVAPTLPDDGELYVAQPPAAGSSVLSSSQQARPLPWLHLETDGEFRASDGCNSGFGEWIRQGDTFSFSNGGFTEMWCEGINPWIQQATSGTLEGNTLLVFDESGELLGTMDRR